MFGVFGALIYPVLRSKLGLASSAVLGFATLNILTSGAIVASFLPGSPFEVSDHIYVKPGLEYLTSFK